MKRLVFFLLGLLLVGSLAMIAGRQPGVVCAQGVPSPTATYDPFVEPFVSENSSKYELGRNWYWHHCMPCHGDKGQGLTDEFRAFWPEDHQNCWGRGCHAGHSEDLGFPIPTIVPPVVNNTQLAQFASRQELYEYLKATHPPQHPGYLSDEQYRAITFYIFTLNNRLSVEYAPDSPTPTFAAYPEPVDARNNIFPLNLIIIFGLGITLFIVILWEIRKRLTEPVEQ